VIQGGETTDLAIGTIIIGVLALPGYINKLLIKHLKYFKYLGKEGVKKIWDSIENKRILFCNSVDCIILY
jgi:hypothetical protein